MHLYIVVMYVRYVSCLDYRLGCLFLDFFYTSIHTASESCLEPVCAVTFKRFKDWSDVVWSLAKIIQNTETNSLKAKPFCGVGKAVHSACIDYRPRQFLLLVLCASVCVITSWAHFVPLVPTVCSTLFCQRLWRHIRHALAAVQTRLVCHVGVWINMLWLLLWLRVVVIKADMLTNVVVPCFCRRKTRWVTAPWLSHGHASGIIPFIQHDTHTHTHTHILIYTYGTCSYRTHWALHNWPLTQTHFMAKYPVPACEGVRLTVEVC